VINLACLRTAVKRWVEEAPARKGAGKVIMASAIVNGDDILFRAPRSLAPFFYQATSEAGLKISVGKNYISENFALINSKMFIQSPLNRMVEKSYLNLRLLEGKDPKSQTCTPDQIGRELNRMVSLVPWTMGCIPYAFRKWVYRKGDWWKPNWFLPANLGGFGINLDYASGLRITPEQKQVASYLVCNPKKAQLSRLEEETQAKPPKGLLPMLLTPYTLAPLEIAEDELPLKMEEDEWLIRIAYIARAMTIQVEPTDPRRKLVHYRHRDVMLKRRRRYLDGVWQLHTCEYNNWELAWYWDMANFVVQGAPCPPMQLINHLLTRSNGFCFRRRESMKDAVMVLGNPTQTPIGQWLI
jgi:hypothetical protein